MLKKSHKALFLDRDGIINVDHGYVYTVESFIFTEGIFDLLHLFLKYDYQIYIVTNQSGIGRGYYTQKDFDTLTRWMVGTFAKKGIVIQGVYHCPHAPQDQCQCRKPETGMIDQCLKHNPIDLTCSWLIGDKQSDIDLAHNASIANTIAIGDRIIHDATFSFKTIFECKLYLEENQDIIQL